jgi:uncharacterized membrane protein YbhN (UPF0104 family)
LRDARRARSRIGWVVSIIALAGVVWWSLRQPAPHLPSTTGELAAMLAAVLAYGVATAVRAQRWGTLLDGVRVHAPRGDTYGLTAVAYMGNAVLPARGGDVLRVTLLNRRTGAPVRTVVGTLVSERVADGACLGLVFAAGAAITHGAGIPPAPMLGALTLVVLAVLAGAGVALAARRSARARRIADFVSPMLESLRRLPGGHGAAIAGLTLAVWLAEAVTWWAVAPAVGIDLAPLQALYLLGIAGVFGLIPSGPGYAGTLDAAVLFGLRALHVAPADAVGYLLALRFVLYVPIALAGAAVLLARYRRWEVRIA